MKNSIAIFVGIFITAYFYLGSFNPAVHKFWTYHTDLTPLKDKPTKPFKKFKHVFKDSNYGTKAFAYPGNLIRYFFGQTTLNDYAYRSNTNKCKGGQVFYINEEIPYDSLNDRTEAKLILAANRIEQIALAFKSLGAEDVIIASVPAKFSIMESLDKPILREDSSRISSCKNPIIITQKGRGTYQYLLGQLNAKNTNYVDLYSSFQKHCNDAEPLFMFEDTHWSGLGISITVKALINKIYAIDSTILKSKQILWDASVKAGDLYGWLLIPNWQFLRTDHHKYFAYEVQPNSIIKQKRKIILLGTSYSIAFNRRLGKQLQKATNAELIDLSIGGKGAFGSFKELIQTNKQNIKGSIIIWEFPFRQIDEIVCASNPQSQTH